ncbi:MAG TPA: tetratricopeptide repeat protein, partial [Desulfomonilia bacterium]|nr:tetratricopeptide repeat protein [Desulfomonilia bacterium]
FLTNGHITFGSFNNRAKISPLILKAWASILHALPSSQLIIKATSLSDEQSRRFLLQQFTSEGIAPERVSIHPYRPSKFDHLLLYNEIDIGLDTFPYNGTTTTCEALWMGVPVATIRGGTHVSRVGSSILACLGMYDLIASSPQDYVDKVVSLAGNLKLLKGMRTSLRERMMKSPLMDSERFTRGLETEYRSMWQRWCASSGAPLGCEHKASPAEIASIISSGEDLFQSGRPAEAEEVFLKALDLDPENVDALNNMGVVCAQSGNRARAIDYFRKVIRIDPEHADAHANLDEMLGEASGN